MQLLRRGDSGPAVAEIRAKLEQFGLLGPEPAENAGHFDREVEQAVRAFQQQRGLITDGIVGSATYRALREAGWRLGDRMLALLISTPMSGDDVIALQEQLLELGYDGGRPHLLREQELLRQAGPRLRGKRIVVDPGHGGRDHGVTVAGVTEADLMWDLARRLEGRMAATGMEALLTRRENTCPTEAERAAFANRAGANLVLSLHVDANRSMHAQGLATFHFGNGSGNTSTVGEALAGYIHRELTSRTALLDLGTQARTWEMLRLTRMPAVRVEIGYLTNLGDRRRLLDPVFRDVVAEGILVGVKRLYLQGKDDQPTGTFTFSDVLARELAGETRIR
jgi:N-acetylmuramoyl-L-alanine amidase